MSILNQLSNHVRTIQAPLSKMSLRTSDRVLQILDTRAKYQTGVATPGYSLDYLRETPEVVFYRGTDRLEAQEADPQITRIVVPWVNMMAPLQFSGTDLEETVGLRSDQMTDDNYSLAEVNNDSVYMFSNFIMTRAAGTASAVQQARVSALWGQDAKIASVDSDRLPTTLPEIFDPSTGLYDEPVDALGEFEEGHVWAATDKTTKATRFGESLAYKMTPRVWDVTRDNGVGTAVAGRTQGTALLGNDAAGRDARFQSLFAALSRYSQIVPGRKLAICSYRRFEELGLRWSKQGSGGQQPYMYPTVTGATWSLQVRSVQIEDTFFISDPYMMEDDAIYVLHLGEGDSGGTVFPFYWDPTSSIPELMRREQEMALREIPDGLTFGTRRDIPFYMDKFERFAGRADAVGAWERLKWMLVCTEPWCQLRLIIGGTIAGNGNWV